MLAEFSEADLAFFTRESEAAEAAARAIASAATDLAGKDGAFLAFRDGTLVASHATAAGLTKILNRLNIDSSSIFVTYLPGSSSIFSL